jgi:hypothetical protein
MTYHIQADNPFQRVQTRHATPESALKALRVLLYFSRADHDKALARLKEGKPAHLVYGFCEGSIFPESPSRP